MNNLQHVPMGAGQAVANGVANGAGQAGGAVVQQGGAAVQAVQPVSIEWDFTLQLGGFCLLMGTTFGFLGGYRRDYSFDVAAYAILIVNCQFFQPIQVATMMFATNEQEKKVWTIIKQTAFAAGTVILLTGAVVTRFKRPGAV
ncbi:hypothetical protein SARC_05141 [Sphaeroforma arctica JP610]|uniref:Uncharacterized protein n=1 Tax=Sphaeroforma arctica JP610 TaxID=667725 RepID=A0A0L0G0F4_9EUKA|nr:hypothetical protein SARC_05141 [Sphaeroforma arctica JP610]KNC82567.1 hypothetical protein SARC_05141 [Sphaeroforma arctica JP610]|eukprot:XP_014156469.1 hypothetical protein SARC_05141 [Sphaeroforma arctica JP610]